MTAPRIVLNMIVKNEAKVIGRCLESALPFADAVVVSDTGSTDGTLKIVEEAAKAKELPYFIDRQMGGRKKVFHWPYGEFDFGTARTYASRAAKFWVKERRWKLGDTYLLFLDADMVLVAEKAFEKSMLRDPHYRLIQKQGGLAYPNTRLGRLDFDWVSCEPTHEYWAPNPDRAPASELFSLWIDDRDDGGSKSDKYDRDVRLLRRRLEKDPKNVRAMYYLAQTYHYMALKYFGMRVDAGGWEGERWYAELMRGKTLAEIDRLDDAVASLLRAADAHGHRSEPASALAKVFREQGKNRLAYGFARMAIERDSVAKTGHDLFVDRGAYWQAKEELSISAYYVGMHDEGWQACEEILRQPGLSYATYETAARNLLFYLPEKWDGVVRRGRFEVPKEMRIFSDSKGEDPVEYLTSSPSIVEHAGAYLVNVRLVNYDHERGRWFVARHKDGVIRTENALIDWYPNADAASVAMRISDAKIYDDWPRGRILGLEDVRLCSKNGDIWFTATTCQVPGSGDKSKVVIGSFDWFYRSASNVEFDVICPLHYEKEREYEKNWLPWALANELMLIYSYEPFVLLKPTPGSCGAPEHARGDCYMCETVVEKTLPFCRMARYRGGAAPIDMGGGRWLFLIHEVAHRENDNVYLHRFIELDSEKMLPTRVSEAFTFHHHGVEYAAGMVKYGANVIVTYGAEERESHWCEIDTTKIRWMSSAQSNYGL